LPGMPEVGGRKTFKTEGFTTLNHRGTPSVTALTAKTESTGSLWNQKKGKKRLRFPGW